MPEWLASLVAALKQRMQLQQQPVQPQPGDPMLADVVNPRRAPIRRLAAEGEAPPLPVDTLPSGATPPAAGAPRFGKGFTPQEIAAQRARLAQILAAQQGQAPQQ